MTAQLNARGDVAVLVPAAGAGLRLGPGAPKALRLLAGEPLLVHAVRRVAAAASVRTIVVAAPAAAVASVRELLAPVAPVTVVAGGAERQESVALALAAVPSDVPIVLVHDAARALTPPSLIESVAAAVRAGHAAVIPVLPVVDTIKEVRPALGRPFDSPSGPSSGVASDSAVDSGPDSAPHSRPKQASGVGADLASVVGADRASGLGVGADPASVVGAGPASGSGVGADPVSTGVGADLASVVGADPASGSGVGANPASAGVGADLASVVGADPAPGPGEGADPASTGVGADPGIELAFGSGGGLAFVSGAELVLGTVDRSVLRSVQTPQGFRHDVLAAVHAGASDPLTDDAGLAEKAGVPVACIPGSELALKITRPFDLIIAEALLHHSP